MKKKISILAAVVAFVVSMSSCGSDPLPEAKVKILATGKDIIVRDYNLKFYEEGDSIQLKKFGSITTENPWDVVTDETGFVEEPYQIKVDSSDKKYGWFIYESEQRIAVIQEKY